ncbi:hypothetical protein CJ030_MR1G028918 [Morella rubra]|uniref:Transmembrane protein n=1 Tax=Morella rubra TaxID=262757 RepID=A0A6A1WR51_9ROSI|nr:hypothetical protein CJ030_MR1G028918 [Morella rubra]
MSGTMYDINQDPDWLIEGEGPPRIDETSAALSPTRRTPEDLEVGEVSAQGPPTSPDVDFIELMEAINIFTGFLAIVMVLRYGVSNSSGPTMCSIAAGQGAPSINGIPDAMMSATESSGRIMCSIAAGQGAPNINGIPNAMMSASESPGVDGTLPVSVVNRPIRSSLEAGRRTPEDPEAGEVPARGPPTSPNVDFIEFLMDAISIFVGFLAIVMELVNVLVPSNKPVEFAVLVLNLISWVTMLITFVVVAVYRGVEFQNLLNGKRYGWKLDCIEIFVATLQVILDIICWRLKLSFPIINEVIFVLSVGFFFLKMGKISKKYS